MVDWSRGNLNCDLIQHPENPANRSYNLLHFAVLVLCLTIPKLWAKTKWSVYL